MRDTTSVTLYLVLTMLRILTEIRNRNRKDFFDEKFVNFKIAGIINIHFKYIIEINTKLLNEYLFEEFFNI